MNVRNLLLSTAASVALLATDAFAQDNSAPVGSAAHALRPKAPVGSSYRPASSHKLLYVAVPGGTSGLPEQGPFPDFYNGVGIVVLDVKDNYSFVKRISWDLPSGHIDDRGLTEVSGITASTATNMIYVETRGRLMAFDIATDKLVWQKEYEFTPTDRFVGHGLCCERAELTPDGKTLVIGGNVTDRWYVADAATGELKGKIMAPESNGSHNMALSPDGKIGFLASATGPVMSIADIPSMKVTKTVKFTNAVRPFVINHDATRIYANVDDLLGFEIADANSGKMIKRVEAPAEMWKEKWANPNNHFFGHGLPGHGIGLTPDESEIWTVDAINYGVLVYDNTGDSPVLNPKKSFKTQAVASWITMGLDGQRAYLSSGDVVDVKSHTIVGTIKDEYGRVMHSEKVLELGVKDGKLVQRELQFSEGVPEAVAARQKAQ